MVFPGKVGGVRKGLRGATQACVRCYERGFEGVRGRNEQAALLCALLIAMVNTEAYIIDE